MSHKNPQRVTVVNENFITLSYGLVLPRYFILSSQPSADHHTTDLHVTTSRPKAPA